jgi:hypothetical protein
LRTANAIQNCENHSDQGNSGSPSPASTGRKREQFDMLHYLLDMAFLEAEDILKQINRAT